MNLKYWAAGVGTGAVVGIALDMLGMEFFYSAAVGLALAAAVVIALGAREPKPEPVEKTAATPEPELARK